MSFFSLTRTLLYNARRIKQPATSLVVEQLIKQKTVNSKTNLSETEIDQIIQDDVMLAPGAKEAARQKAYKRLVEPNSALWRQDGHRKGSTNNKISEQTVSNVLSTNTDVSSTNTNEVSVKQTSKMFQNPMPQSTLLHENPHKLVNRPPKGASWSLAGELILANPSLCPSPLTLQPTPQSLFQFLQLQQVKDLYLFDFLANQQEEQRRDSQQRRYQILGSCYSARHCWKVGQQLKKALGGGRMQLNREAKEQIDRGVRANRSKKREDNVDTDDNMASQSQNVNGKSQEKLKASQKVNQSFKPNQANSQSFSKPHPFTNYIYTPTASLSGSKTDEWILVSYGDFQINLLTVQQRQAIDLEWKWNNPVSEEVQEKFKNILMNRKGRKNMMEDL